LTLLEYERNRIVTLRCINGGAEFLKDCAKGLWGGEADEREFQRGARSRAGQY